MTREFLNNPTKDKTLKLMRFLTIYDYGGSVYYDGYRRVFKVREEDDANFLLLLLFKSKCPLDLIKGPRQQKQGLGGLTPLWVVSVNIEDPSWPEG